MEVKNVFSQLFKYHDKNLIILICLEKILNYILNHFKHIFRDSKIDYYSKCLNQLTVAYDSYLSKSIVFYLVIVFMMRNNKTYIKRFDIVLLIILLFIINDIMYVRNNM